MSCKNCFNLQLNDPVAPVLFCNGVILLLKFSGFKLALKYQIASTHEYFKDSSKI